MAHRTWNVSASSCVNEANGLIRSGAPKLGQTLPSETLPRLTSSEAEKLVHVQVGNVLLQRLAQLPASRQPCPLANFDPAAPWMAPECTVFPYSGLDTEYSLSHLAQVQIYKGML